MHKGRDLPLPRAANADRMDHTDHSYPPLPSRRMQLQPRNATESQRAEAVNTQASSLPATEARPGKGGPLEWGEGGASGPELTPELSGCQYH